VQRLVVVDCLGPFAKIIGSTLFRPFYYLCDMTHFFFGALLVCLWAVTGAKISGSTLFVYLWALSHVSRFFVFIGSLVCIVLFCVFVGSFFPCTGLVFAKCGEDRRMPYL